MSSYTTKTIQSNIHKHTFDDITKYSLMMGGLNVVHDSLQQYDPLTTGYGRLFMVRRPIFVEKGLPTHMKKFKHILEYANVGVSGIGNIELRMNNITGGYAGRKFDVASTSEDQTDGFTVKLYEFSGSPIREVVHYWITGISDLQSGYSTYHGVDLEVLSSNHTAEFIYVVTDRSGRHIEYACLLANCMPKNVKEDHFNYDAGEHNIVQIDLEFTGTRYESRQINTVAANLLERYQVLLDSLDFNSGITKKDIEDTGAQTYYDGGLSGSNKLVNTKPSEADVLLLKKSDDTGSPNSFQWA